MKALLLLSLLFSLINSNIQQHKEENIIGKRCLMAFAIGMYEKNKWSGKFVFSRVTQNCKCNSAEHKKASDYFDCLIFQEFSYQEGKCSNHDYIITGRDKLEHSTYSAIIKNTCYLNKNISEHQIDLFENGEKLYSESTIIPFEEKIIVKNLTSLLSFESECFLSSVINCQPITKILNLNLLQLIKLNLSD